MTILYSIVTSVIGFVSCLSNENEVMWFPVAFLAVFDAKFSFSCELPCPVWYHTTSSAITTAGLMQTPGTKRNNIPLCGGHLPHQQPAERTVSACPASKALLGYSYSVTAPW